LAIIESLNAEFADIGQFHVASARRWYLRLNAAVDHAVQPQFPPSPVAASTANCTKALPLTRWLNEVQMFLHGHPVNERRRGQRQAGSQQPVAVGRRRDGSNRQLTSEFSSIWTDNPLATGLAHRFAYAVARSG
jgi:hypothetical protein